MLLSRPTVIGNTTPGNNTVFLNGNKAISEGISTFSFDSASLSFKGIMGIKSISCSGFILKFTRFSLLISKRQAHPDNSLGLQIYGSNCSPFKLNQGHKIKIRYTQPKPV